MSGFCHGGVGSWSGSAGVFFLEVGLYDVYNLGRGCDDVIVGWVSYGLKLGLVFGVWLESGRRFKVLVVAFGAFIV